jgi:hypothetical protein
VIVKAAFERAPGAPVLARRRGDHVAHDAFIDECGIDARATAPASRTTMAPSCGAVKSFNEPRNFPVGIRTARTMKAFRMALSF